MLKIKSSSISLISTCKHNLNHIMHSFLTSFSLPLLLLFSFYFITPSSSSITMNSMLQAPQHVHHMHNKHTHHHAWQRFEKLTNASKGSHVEGIAELKCYFKQFGYYHSLLPKNAKQDDDYYYFTNEYDDHLEHVVTLYQQHYGLPVTGTLNPETISMLKSPRCGMPDHHQHSPRRASSSVHATRHFRYFSGRPRWARHVPMTLTYAFSLNDMIAYMSLHDIKGAFERSFAKWASVIPVKFVETHDLGLADIKIGFYSGDHGDGEPFDGVLGVLAHAFSPENGRFHLDAAETWTVDFDKEESSVAVDLESVALHEIGHLLGLAHSNVKKSVMYPSLKPREKKLVLRFDDIEGVQYLYGSNPNFTINALLASETSSSQPSIFIGGYSKEELLQHILSSLLIISITYFYL